MTVRGWMTRRRGDRREIASRGTATVPRPPVGGWESRAKKGTWFLETGGGPGEEKILRLRLTVLRGGGRQLVRKAQQAGARYVGREPGRRQKGP